MFEVEIELTVDDLNSGDMFKLNNNSDEVYMKIDVYPYVIDLKTGKMLLISDRLAIVPVTKYTIHREKEN